MSDCLIQQLCKHITPGTVIVSSRVCFASHYVPEKKSFNDTVWDSTSSRWLVGKGQTVTITAYCNMGDGRGGGRIDGISYRSTTDHSKTGSVTPTGQSQTVTLTLTLPNDNDTYQFGLYDWTDPLVACTTYDYWDYIATVPTTTIYDRCKVE